MSTSPTRIEADYTRGAVPCTRRITPGHAALVVVGCVVAVAGLLPLDGAAMEFARRFGESGDLRLGGDLRRELLFVQQWGDFVCSLLVLTASYLLDTARRARLWDAVGAIAVTAVAYQSLKILVGRPRPKYGDPMTFFTSVRPYDLDGTARYSWEVWGGISSNLWSMPSSHSAAAMCLSVILMRLYPRLTPLVLPLAFVVAVCRVLFTAHYPSDVVAGLAVGYLGAGVAMDRCWGTRLAARLGRKGTESSGPRA
jgi:membrane-associated phospholipid phosphatase